MKNVLQKSAIATLGVVLAMTVLGGMTLHLWGQTLTFRTLDPGTIGALLVPVYGAWVTSLHDRFEDADGDGIPDSQQAKPAPKA